MKPMSHEANQLVNAGRLAFQPTDADRARVMSALTGAATLSVGVVVAGSAAKRSLNSILAAVPSARLLAFALPVAAAGALGFYAAVQSPAKAQVTRVIPAPPQRFVPQTVAPAAKEREPLPAAQTTESSAPASSERSAAVVSEVPKPGVEIRQEVALLSKAQAALSRGRPQEALDALSQHAQRFPRGALTEERVATRARTLCALGRRQEAEVELKRIEKLNPGSAYLARARQSCGSR